MIPNLRSKLKETTLQKKKMTVKWISIIKMQFLVKVYIHIVDEMEPFKISNFISTLSTPSLQSEKGCPYVF